jgi:hypothetical protein
MASQHDLAEQLLQRASDDEAAARAMLPIDSVTDMIVGMLAQQGSRSRSRRFLLPVAWTFPLPTTSEAWQGSATKLQSLYRRSWVKSTNSHRMRARCDTTARTRNWWIGRRRCAGPQQPSPGHEFMLQKVETQETEADQGGDGRTWRATHMTLSDMLW